MCGVGMGRDYSLHAIPGENGRTQKKINCQWHAMVLLLQPLIDKHSQLCAAWLPRVTLFHGLGFMGSVLEAMCLPPPMTFPRGVRLVHRCPAQISHWSNSSEAISDGPSNLYHLN